MPVSVKPPPPPPSKGPFSCWLLVDQRGHRCCIWSCGAPPPHPPYYICHLIRVGDHPPNFTVLGMTECEASPAPAWDGHQGAEAARVTRGATVPLSPITNTLPHRLGSNVDNLFLKTQTSVYTRACTLESTNRNWHMSSAFILWQPPRQGPVTDRWRMGGGEGCHSPSCGLL